MEMTPAQRDALADVRRVARRSGGALLYDTARTRMHGSALAVHVALSTISLFPTLNGVPLRTAEPVALEIPRGFPFDKPRAFAEHLDLAGRPHIQWGNEICLYASAADWDSVNGMQGFLRRLVNFYGHLARGTLDGPEMPWHPPVAYTDRAAHSFVVRADLPRSMRETSRPTLQWAVASRRSDHHVDLVGWLATGDIDVSDVDGVGSVLRHYDELRDAHEDPAAAFLIPAVHLPRPIAFEYPDDVGTLLNALHDAGIDAQRVLSALTIAAWVNAQARRSQDRRQESFLLIRARGPRSPRGPTRPAHFAAWHLTSKSLADAATLTLADFADEEVLYPWVSSFSAARTRWSAVHDARPEVVTRRDHGRPVTRLLGSRVLLLGCGALGRPIAEHCVRAGVDTLMIVDRARVSPGLLVRQGYAEADIGRLKAEVLKGDLERIRRDVRICCSSENLVTGDLLTPESLSGYDFVIDATADGTVAARLELARRQSDVRPGTLSVGIDRDARTGLVTVAPPGAVSAGADLWRQLVIAAPGADLDDAISSFTDRDHGELFEPEPGCSSPTFVGSHSDVAGLAALMLNAGLDGLKDSVLSVTPGGESWRTSQRPSACVIRTATAQPAVTRVAFPHPVLLQDVSARRYEIRVDPNALADLLCLAAEPRHVATDPHVPETGGLLLGQFDDAIGVAWISEVTGPPRGSVASPVGLVLNVPAAMPYVDSRIAATRGVVRLIGTWHTHPQGSTHPSGTDLGTVRGSDMRQRLLVVVPGSADPVVNGIHAEVFFAEDEHHPAT